MPPIPLATDKKDGARITADLSRSRAIFICGKRGSGKSYTLGRLIEQIQQAHTHLIVVVDPLAIFWTTALPLPNLQTQTPAIPVRLIIPGGPARLGPLADAMRARGVDLVRLRLNPCHLSPEGWVMLFGAKLTDPQGILLFRTVMQLQQQKPDLWQLSDLRALIEADKLAADSTKGATLNRITAAQAWDIFETSPDSEMLQIFQTGAINIVDVSLFEPGRTGLRNLVVKLICDRLFIARVERRRAELLSPLLQGEGSGEGFPPVFLFIDEAHDYCPADGDALAKPALVRWAKEGRQPGLSLAIATQQPAALDFNLISQCDLFLIHHITLADDVRTVARLSTSYAHDIPAFLKGVRKPGEALIVDDLAETLAIGQVLPRQAVHGGSEALKNL